MSINPKIIDTLHAIVAGQKQNLAITSVFCEISGSFYYENFHSDLLAFYLKNEEVKKIFIEWLDSRAMEDGKTELEYEDYKGGKILRESSRVDVLLLSRDETRAIIIENKSNNAVDQFNQLHGYAKSLEERGRIIEKILYLNKDSLKKPDLSGLDNGERARVESKLKVENLDAFINNVINKTLAQTNDIRLHGLSQEIRSLFKILIHKDMNVEKIIELARSLNADGGRRLGSLKELMEAYNGIPAALAEYFREYLTGKAPSYSLQVWSSRCIMMEEVLIGGRVFSIDIWFSHEEVDFSFFIRPKRGDRHDVDNVRTRAGSLFPFKDFINERFRFRYPRPFDVDGITNEMDRLLESLKRIQTLPDVE